MKKRILAILFVCMFALGLVAACADDSAPAAPAPAPAPAEAPAEAPAAAPAEPAPAAGEEAAPAPAGLRPTTIVFPRTLEALEDSPWWAAKVLGFWEEEGLDVTFEQSFGTTDIRMVALGQADFACPGTSFILAGIEEGLPIKVVSAYDGINIWGMCVLKDGPIQSWDDMKDAQNKYGRRLTVALGDAAWEMLVTPTIVAAGVDPVNDLEFVVAGEGRHIQVKEGNLDMVFTWPGEAWQIMGQGFPFIYIDGHDVLQINSNPLITNLNLIENEPQVVEGLVRGLLKGMYFTRYSPEAAAAMMADVFPAIDISWEGAIGVQLGRAYQMFGPPGGPLEKRLLDDLGKNWDDMWQAVMDTTVEAGVIQAPIPLDRVFTNAFVDNTSWSREEIQAIADNWDVESVKARHS